MQRLIAIFLMIVLCSNILMTLGVFLSWKTNQSFIVKNSCENRSKPSMHCNGKCKLRQQLKKLDQQAQSDNDKAEEKLKQVDDYIYLNQLNIKNTRHPIYQEFALKQMMRFINHYSFLFIDDRLQPPKCAV